MHKTVGVALILVLGTGWWLLAEFSSPAPEVIAGAPGAVPAGPLVPPPVNPAVDPAAAPASDPAAAPVQAAPEQQPAAVTLSRSEPTSPAVSSPEGAIAPAPAPAGTAGRDDAGYAEALATASRLQSTGDRAGAEAALRQAMQRAGSPVEAARAGMQLAALSANPAERRQLLGAAVIAGAVIGEDYESVSRMLRELNRSPGTSLLPLLESQHYTVQANDSLWKLCNKVFPSKYGVSPEVGLIQLVNGMSSDRLKLGQTLAIPTQPAAVRVDMLQHGLTVWLGDTLVAAYRVGLGKESRTPAGTFTILVKQEKPTWFYGGRTIPFGDPENVLGTRWMGFDDQPGATGLGIHGTMAPESVGRDESMGCVRMRNEEVEELFVLLPRGTKVTIS
jgi:LysM repeat protein